MIVSCRQCSGHLFKSLKRDWYLIHKCHDVTFVYTVQWCTGTTTESIKNIQLLTYLQGYMHPWHLLWSIKCIWVIWIVMFNNSISFNKKLLVYVSRLWQQATAPSSGGCYYYRPLRSHARAVGADGSSREAIRQGGLWKFLTVRQTYPLSN